MPRRARDEEAQVTSPAAGALSSRALRLRQDFDSAFARVPDTDMSRRLDFLAIRAGEYSYAVRLVDVSGLAVDRAVTPVPVATNALLGVTAFRGSIVTVYDLGMLLGQERGKSLPWLIVTAAAPGVGFAFDQFDGHLRVAEDAVATERGKGPKRTTSGAREVLRTDASVLPILQVSVVLDGIRARVDEGSSSKEQ